MLLSCALAAYLQGDEADLSPVAPFDIKEPKPHYKDGSPREDGECLHVSLKARSRKVCKSANDGGALLQRLLSLVRCCMFSTQF